MRPVCFMVMPFRRKPVTGARPDAPRELDCDRLWDAAFLPALDELGYLPVRANVDTGSVIVKDMLNRLRHPALVVADVSLPNGNVYYEVGIRHAAREDRCVLLAAEWSRQLFDVDQFRSLRYPLRSGEVPDDEARKVRELLVQGLPPLTTARTPFFELVDDDVTGAFEDEAEVIAAFQAELAAVRLMAPGDGRQARVRSLIEAQSPATLGQPEIAIELVAVVRDVLSWRDVLVLVERLPGHVRRTETVQEQRLLAEAYLGHQEDAIAGLQELIARRGSTPERLGLLGGRYKRLWRDEREQRLAGGGGSPSGRERRLLDAAIEAYETGMGLDLNEYYCSSNLPGLLHARGAVGDRDKAAGVDVMVIAACRRAERLGTSDEWLRDTLFGAAFRSGDLAGLDELESRIDSGVAWRLRSTLDDARDWIALAPPELRSRLEERLSRFSGVFHQPDPGSV
jgi:hypothetical protein